MPSLNPHASHHHALVMIPALLPHPTIRQLAVVSEGARLSFLPTHFGAHGMKFENLLVSIARKTITGYNGGYWEFAETSSGAALAYPKAQRENQMLEVRTLFGDNPQLLPVELAGLITSALAVLQFVSHPDHYRISDDQQERYYDQYYALLDTGRAIAKQTGYAQEFSELTD